MIPMRNPHHWLVCFGKMLFFSSQYWTLNCLIASYYFFPFCHQNRICEEKSVLCCFFYKSNIYSKINLKCTHWSLVTVHMCFIRKLNFLVMVMSRCKKNSKTQNGISSWFNFCIDTSGTGALDFFSSEERPWIALFFLSPTEKYV